MKDHITICICTLHRNEMLERLLRKVALQETSNEFTFSVVIVDNDAKGAAKETVLRLKDELGLEISYEIELEQTIPAARNHALRLAKGNYIGIIDDDEFPPPHWLYTMYRAIQTFDVDGALGPVYPFFEHTPPDWLIKSRLCERPVYPTGTLLRWNQTRTGNVLLKKNVFDNHNLCFDSKWKTSGSDRAFFREAMGVGCRFVAVEEAPVYEVVPLARWNKSYYLKRALVHGFNSHKNNETQMSRKTIVMMYMKSFTALLVYAFVIPFYFCAGSHAVMRYLERGAHHLSYLLSMIGIELVKKRNF